MLLTVVIRDCSKMEYLHKNGITPQLVNGKIRLMPPGSITDAIREYTRQNKSKIIGALQQLDFIPGLPRTKVIQGQETTKDVKAISTAKPEQEQAPSLQIDLPASGQYLHNEFNRLRRLLRRFPDNESMFQELYHLTGRIDDFWTEPKFKEGWFYG